MVVVLVTYLLATVFIVNMVETFSLDKNIETKQLHMWKYCSLIVKIKL